MKDIHQKLLATFQIEHLDHVEQIRSLLAMSEKTEAPMARADLEEVFRRAHSLKGAARAVDLRAIEELAHRLEALFSRVLQGNCALDKNVSRVVQQALDASEDCMAAPASQPVETLGAALRALDSLSGAQAPEVQAKVAGEPAAAKEPVPVPAFQPLETVRITAENFDGLFRTAAGLVAESQRRDQVAEELDELALGIALIEKEGEQARRVAESMRRPEASRELSRLTSLVGSMEQRARSISRKARMARRLHQHRGWSLRQLGKQLHQDIRQARMVPAESLLDGYRKMMRDLARDEGKEIEFRATSASVHADRRVLEALKDPIMHVLRNAVSHGIEPARERTGKGKTAAGLVSLRIDADGQRLTVVIEDDGRGVDLARVAEVAVREGILAGPAAASSTARELTRILLRPGFSTAATVTNLAGRGMGLSVVYEAVRRLQGDLDVRPGAAGGTAIAFSVPLSIASHRLIIVRCGKEVFAIPVPGIERLLRVKRSIIETVEGKPVIVFNRQPVPLTNIHALLELEQSSAPADTDMVQVVILRSGGRRIALAVDAVIREVEAVIQDLGHAAGCGGRISSAAVLDDGSIAFAVNPMELLESAFEPGVRRHTVTFARASPAKTAGATIPAAVAQPVPRNILVVDDSMTTRALEKSILEAHGYEVRVAVDGMDALTRLQEEIADLVIADIEMPRLTGFGLIEAMKKDHKLERIPVIIVSSVERREDQERGLALGADAYIVKRKFDQEELLATIRQIL